MNATRAAGRAAVGIVAVLFLTAACGWAEWPPPGRQPRDVNRPPPPAATPLPAPAAIPLPVPAAIPLPVPERAPAAAAGGAVIVGAGDTVYALSRRHGVFVRAIIDANRLRPPYRLRVGQRVVLPRGREHVIRGGETLYGISRLNGVGVYEMARANGLKPPYTIRAGQRLRVPGSAGTAGKGTPPGAKAAPGPRPAARKKPAVQAAIPALRPKTPKAPAAVPKPPPRSGRGFLWPLKGRVLSAFGAKARGLRNDGINIAAPRGSPVRAAENGVVAYAGNELRGFGNLLLIKHTGGWVSAYAHNQTLLVKRGDRVRKRQVIAKVGSSGNVSAPQLHFELRRGRRAVDPRKHLTDGRV
ncbi:MAG: LysM peptidoglycan-binding domain-containing M23 family metallopeptidase [Alphaproteobacteria bacterium]|nr:LysM peptidoglycan-binding domain-containing M23 family metallopeptidase [Alphaproteobacteria bacterium]